ncbi:NADP-dependent malic enzyme-like [Coccinella septempunctata]|uniref:NADP-dependent malic enzyme-like n=1 Tax=Coccinella septempunctata TaxID=41139 RepID=UPI001D06FAE3|nr:NADP-dependent malic enzyme-like [Coccinella septempunctata]
MFVKILKLSSTCLNFTKKSMDSNYLRFMRGICSDQIGDVISLSQVKGIDHLKNPRLNKGLAFTIEERQVLGIHGLQPPTQRTQDEQLKLCKITINNYKEPLNKYIYLTELKDRNEKLYFRLLSENIEDLLPIVYTPTVGLACQRFGLIYRRPHGLFITINDRGYIYEILQNWPEPNIHAIVVTDGERILGLGDLGAYGMGIPIGKLALYTALAGIKPYHCLPIQLDVGTENTKLLEDPAYVGLRQKRARGKVYDDFIDEFMAAVVKRYGQDTLIQFEDFGNLNAARLLAKYRNKYCTFNDDIQGTAAVSLAGLMAANKIIKKTFRDHKIVFYGAGTAALGVADLCVEAMLREGIDLEEARGNIFMMDVDGLVTSDRKVLQGNQKYYAKKLKPEKDLLSLVNQVKPTVLIGVSTKGGAFTPEVLKAMAKHNERPVVFALSNPTSNAECTPQEAYDNTDGRVIFCSGSPFPEVKYGGRSFKTGQGNNSYIFPGVALGVVLGQIHHIPEDYFLLAASVVADNVSKKDLEEGRLFPPLNMIKDCSVKIATAILQDAYKNGKATWYPEPDDKKKYIESRLYCDEYTESLNRRWKWPKETKVPVKPMDSHTKVTIT